MKPTPAATMAPGRGTSARRPAVGALVTSVAPDSPASEQIQPGDVIEAINQHPVASPGDAAAQLQVAAKSGRKAILMLLNRQGTNLYVGVAVG